MSKPRLSSILNEIEKIKLNPRAKPFSPKRKRLPVFVGLTSSLNPKASEFKPRGRGLTRRRSSRRHRRRSNRRHRRRSSRRHRRRSSRRHRRLSSRKTRKCKICEMINCKCKHRKSTRRRGRKY